MINAFEKDPSDEFIAEIAFVKQPPHNELEEIFRFPIEQMACLSCKIDHLPANQLSKYLAEPLQLDKYDYFLELN